MDPHQPAKRQRPASARQRRQAISNSAHTRNTQQSSGGVSAAQRGNADNTSQDAAAEAQAGGAVAAALRERIQSGALATASVVSERVRRVSQFTRRATDPLGRPSTWIVEPTWYERLHNWLADVMPFTWRERARHRGFWRKRALPVVAIVACLALAIGVGLFALSTAGRAAGALSTSPAAQATTGGSVMISPYNNGLPSSPTPVAEPYDIGVWVSNTLPQGGSVMVYARVSNNSQPVPHARVYIYASTPRGGISLGPITTDAYGLASVRLNYGNVGSQKPIFLTGTTTINGHKITGQYTFVTF